MNSVGKPDAANPHVRFDERGRETEPLAKPQRHRALPRLYNRRVARLDRGGNLIEAAVVIDARERGLRPASARAPFALSSPTIIIAVAP